MLLRVGDRAAAEVLTDQVLAHSQERQLHRLAQQAVRKAAWRQVVDRYNDAVDEYQRGHFSLALEILEELMPNVHQVHMRRKVQELATKARSAQVEQEGIDRINEQIERYNLAVAKVQAGDLAAAGAILAQLLDEVEDPKLARSTLNLLEKVRSQLEAHGKRQG